MYLSQNIPYIMHATRSCNFMLGSQIPVGPRVGLQLEWPGRELSATRGYETYPNPIKPEDLVIKHRTEIQFIPPRTGVARGKNSSCHFREMQQALSFYREVARLGLKRCAAALPYTALQEHAYSQLQFCHFRFPEFSRAYEQCNNYLEGRGGWKAREGHHVKSYLKWGGNM